MDADLSFVLGSLFALFAVPAVVSAFSEGRPPRLAALMFVIGGGLMAFAIGNKPGGYSFEEIPGVFASVIGQLIN